MKTSRSTLALAVLILGAGMFSLLLRAQETATPVQSGAVSEAAVSPSDFEVELQALEMTTPMPPSELPDESETHGFYSAQNPDWPPLPDDVLELPIWPLGDGLYVLDDTNVNYVELAQSQPAVRSQMTDDFSPDFNFSTNSLWLQMLSVTNGMASLVIHPPTNVTNGVYDLLYCTNLAPPILWQSLLRSYPGQTNLVVSNATDVYGFYRLGPPDDLTANDSLGTNFWVAFFNMYDGTNNDLSLYISSPVGATGTVTIPGVTVNGPELIVTGCEDVTVNGTYLLTNVSENISGTLITSAYVKGTNQEVNTYGPYGNNPEGHYYLIDYDSSNSETTFLYFDEDNILSSTNWIGFGDTNSPPTNSSCAQVPFTNTFSVTTGMVTTVVVPVAAMITNYGGVETNGINIVASQPVSVYGFNYFPAASTAFTVYPTTLLGTNYCVMARASEDILDSGYNYSQFAIVATADNTTNIITPSATANLAGHSGTYTNILQQGDTYQIKSSTYTNDVTGTLITSDQPIGVFAGASVAFVPDDNDGTGNPLLQEQLPVDSWGTQALALSFAGRTNGDSYRVLAAYSNTVVTITGKVVTIVDSNVYPNTVTTSNEVVVVTIQAGQFYDIIVDGPVEFQASQPIQVAQFANGNEFDNPNPGEGDPCEILLLATGYYLDTNTVVTLPNDGVTGDFDENYLNLIVAQSAITNTLVDDSPVAATNFVAIGTSGYSGAQITVTNSGVHTVTSSQPVGVEVYGWGEADAYGYFGGVVK